MPGTGVEEGWLYLPQELVKVVDARDMSGRELVVPASGVGEGGGCPGQEWKRAGCTCHRSG